MTKRRSERAQVLNAIVDPVHMQKFAYSEIPAANVFKLDIPTAFYFVRIYKLGGETLYLDDFALPVFALGRRNPRLEPESDSWEKFTFQNPLILTPCLEFGHLGWLAVGNICWHKTFKNQLDFLVEHKYDDLRKAMDEEEVAYHVYEGMTIGPSSYGFYSREMSDPHPDDVLGWYRNCFYKQNGISKSYADEMFHINANDDGSTLRDRAVYTLM